GHLHVTAHKRKTQPHKRIEPVKDERKKSKRLDQIILPADMGSLVFQDVGQVGISNVCRHIDFRADKAAYEGCADGISFKDIGLHTSRGLKLSFDFYIRNDAVNKQRNNAKNPNKA